MKKILLLIIAAFLVTSCSKTENPSPESVNSNQSSQECLDTDYNC